MYSLQELDVTKSCEQLFEFEVTDDVTGKGTGLFLSVIGGHAQEIADYTKKNVNERRHADAMADKRDPRGKNLQVRKIEDDIDFSTSLIAIRVKAWRGMKEPCTFENAFKLCTINPPIREQILAVSENLKNFPSPFSTNSASTADTPAG